MLLLETGTFNSSWQNSGRVLEHQALRTRLISVWWFIPITMATCCILFTKFRSVKISKHTVVCRDNILPSELKNLKFSELKFSKPTTVEPTEDDASLMPCYESIVWNGTDFARLWDIVHQSQKQSIFPWAASGWTLLCLRKLPCEFFYISILCKRKQAYFLISRIWEGLWASSVTNCFITSKHLETFKKLSVSVENKGRCKLLKIAANGSYDATFATCFANLWTRALWHEEQPILLGDTSRFTKFYVCWFNCEVLYWYSPWKWATQCVYFKQAKQTERIFENISTLAP